MGIFDIFGKKSDINEEIAPDEQKLEARAFQRQRRDLANERLKLDLELKRLEFERQKIELQNEIERARYEQEEIRRKRLEDLHSLEDGDEDDGNPDDMLSTLLMQVLSQNKGTPANNKPNTIRETAPTLSQTQILENLRAQWAQANPLLKAQAKALSDDDVKRMIMQQYPQADMTTLETALIEMRQ
jgi:hypothetical protein